MNRKRLRVGSRSSLDQCFAEIITPQQIDESLRHIVETIYNRLSIYDLATFDPFMQLSNCFRPATDPPRHNESFHFQLFVHDGRLNDTGCNEMISNRLITSPSFTLIYLLEKRILFRCTLISNHTPISVRIHSFAK